ncbi:glycosyltransferase family 4 protein [Hoeflea prorocentri]|uniref:Glycosyltransferase family 1 protein n=1 Tax=Hoeflea prorocentri TaxID=1922333 RepID=A0A9X3ZGI9_9HYPH|nr:glycosyltransferase family 1 protein [Hoeflea prorocentri]MCY6379846.1 glycosyltransferase family 1 protein [Hoeflea prorocentri]MDA5397646.1 glycosyltransferase family 1 protein [Hoeflea prorocentri]
MSTLTRLSVDARNLLSYRNGIGRTILETCHTAAQRDTKITLYWPQKPKIIPKEIHEAENRYWDKGGGINRVLWSGTSLPRSVNKTGPDIFWGPAHRVPIGLNRSIPCVVTIHDLVWAKHPQTMRRLGWLADRILAPHAMRRADVIVAVSKSTRDDILERYPQFTEKVHVIYPGVSVTTDIKTNKGGEYQRDGDYALFVGTIEPRKNLQSLLKAIAISRAAGHLAGRLLIAGGKGWRHAELGDLIDRYNLADCVQALGYVSDAELARLYKDARFLAMPSLYEGFGLPIIEAGSYGVPALTSNVSSMPEVAGKAGLLVDPHDPHDIARGWQRLWNDDALHAELSSHARENAARFSWSKTADEMLSLFQDVIDRHRQANSS